jgi:hypothetical protein
MGEVRTSSQKQPVFNWFKRQFFSGYGQYKVIPIQFLFWQYLLAGSV